MQHPVYMSRSRSLFTYSLDPMTTRDSPPNSPNPVLKRAYSLPIYQLAWREMRRGPPAICLEQLKVPVSHDLAPGELLVEVCISLFQIHILLIIVI